MTALRRFALAVLLALPVGCATPDLPGGVPADDARQAPDDGDLLAVVPAEAEMVVVLDMAKLRRSPWTRAVVMGAQGAAPGRSRGFDDVKDVDRLVVARLPADHSDGALKIAQGRFDRERVRVAFAAGGAVTDNHFRGCLIWSRGMEATTFLTDRTLLSGALPAVRAAIDTAYGRARDVRGSGWWLETRRPFGDKAPPPAIELAVQVTDPMRSRLRAELEEAEGLVRLGGRIEVGERLDIAMVGATATRQQATALIARVGAELRTLESRPSVVALGLAPVLSDVQYAVQGPRLAAELRLKPDQRDEIVDRLTALSRLLAAAPVRPLESPAPSTKEDKPSR